MKFKIGDSVRLNKNKKEFKYGRGFVSYKEVGTIERLDKDKYVVNFPSHSCWNGKEEELELVLTTFTKSDLKDGDIVTYRDGTRRRVRDNKLLSEDGYSGNRLENYNNNLKNKDGGHNLDIVKVERPTYKTVFERKEEILDETEKRYLKQVIRPFKDKVKTIEKNIIDDMDDIDNGEFITINFKNYLDSFSLPTFKKETMYKGMKIDKQYTLEELEL